MINLNGFANGENVEDVLSKQGLTLGAYANFANQARRNIQFLRMLNVITDEEEQMIFQRLIAKMAGWIDVK